MALLTNVRDNTLFVNVSFLEIVIVYGNSIFRGLTVNGILKTGVKFFL